MCINLLQHLYSIQLPHFPCGVKIRYLHLGEYWAFSFISEDPACSEPFYGFPPNPAPPRPAGSLLFPLNSLLPKLLFNSLHSQRCSRLSYLLSDGRGPFWLHSWWEAAALALHKEHWGPPGAAPTVCPPPSWSSALPVGHKALCAGKHSSITWAGWQQQAQLDLQTAAGSLVLQK